jgi:hypothetical protein
MKLLPKNGIYIEFDNMLYLNLIIILNFFSNPLLLHTEFIEQLYSILNIPKKEEVVDETSPEERYLYCI